MQTQLQVLPAAGHQEKFPPRQGGYVITLFLSLVCLWSGLHQNYWTVFHETWTEDGSRPRIDTMKVWYGSRHFFSLSLTCKALSLKVHFVRKMIFSNWSNTDAVFGELGMRLKKTTLLRSGLFISQGIMHGSWWGAEDWHLWVSIKGDHCSSACFPVKQQLTLIMFYMLVWLQTKQTKYIGIC